MFVTDEVWSWWQPDRSHQAPWPTSAELLSQLADNSDATRQADERAYQWATDLLFEVRKTAIGSEAAAEGADRESDREGGGRSGAPSCR